MKTKIILLAILATIVFSCKKPAEEPTTTDNIIEKLSYKWNLYATSTNDIYNYVDTAKRSTIMEFRKNMTFTFVEYWYLTLGDSSDVTLTDTFADGIWNLQNNNLVNLAYQTYEYTLAYDTFGYVIGIADSTLVDSTQQFSIIELLQNKLTFSEQIYYQSEDMYFPSKYHLNKTFKE